MLLLLSCSVEKYCYLCISFNGKIHIKMAKFFTRTSKKNGTANLYTKVQRPKFGIVWWVCCYVPVDVEAWNKAQKSPKALMNFFATERGKEIQAQTEMIDGIIRMFFDEVKNPTNADKDKLERQIKSIINAKSQKAKEEAKELARRRKEMHLNEIHAYYDDFLAGIKSGTIRHHDGKVYTKSTISTWVLFGKYLKGYTPKKMTFADIDVRFRDGFRPYLEKTGMMLGTINKYIACFRHLCLFAAEEGRNANMVSARWRIGTEKAREKRVEIALTDEEVNALYDMPLMGIREQVRDMFVLGLLTAQRVSDFTQFRRDNFKRTKSGTDVVVFRQQKTGTDVMVTITDDRVLQICEKYDFDFPPVTTRDINRYIKEVCHDLAASVPTLRDMVATQLSFRERRKEALFADIMARVGRGERLNGEERKRFVEMQEYAKEHGSREGELYRRDAGAVMVYRWEVVTSHTARRSGITSLYNSGLLDNKDIMSISGHTTLKTFENYIKRGAEEQADRIAEKLAAARQAKTIKLKKEA